MLRWRGLKKCFVPLKSGIKSLSGFDQLTKSVHHAPRLDVVKPPSKGKFSDGEHSDYLTDLRKGRARSAFPSNSRSKSSSQGDEIVALTQSDKNVRLLEVDKLVAWSYRIAHFVSSQGDETWHRRLQPRSIRYYTST